MQILKPKSNLISLYNLPFFFLILGLSIGYSQNEMPSQLLFNQSEPEKIINLTNDFAKSSNDSILIQKWRKAEGPCLTVALSQNLVFFNNGGYLDIYDIEDAYQPKLLSRSLLNFIPADFLIEQNYLFIRNATDKIIIIDFENPENPQIVNYIDLGPEPIFDWKIYQQKIYLAEGNGLTIIDISNPEQPELVISDLPLFHDFIHTFDIENNVLYTYLDKELYLFDIFKTKEPEIITNFPLQNDFKDILVYKNYIYLIHPQHLQIWDFTEIFNPKLVNTYSINCSNTEICSYIWSNHLFINCLGNELTVIDISNPLHPEELNKVQGQVFDVSSKDSLLFLANFNELKISEISKLGTEINDIINIQTGRRLSVLGIKNQYMYLHSYNLFSIFDMTDMNYPVQIKTFPDQLKGTKLKFFQNFAFQSMDDSLFVFDFTDPKNPHLVGTYYLGYSALNLQIFTHYLILSSYRNGLTVFDITKPVYPIEISHFSELKLGKTEVIGSYLYGEDISAFYIINLRNPQNIAIEGIYLPDGYINDFCIKGNDAFLCIDDSGILILDITDPLLPKYQTNIPGRFKKCVIESDYLITMPDINLFDISRPRYPEPLKNYHLDNYLGSEGELTVSGNHIFVLEENLGLYIFENKSSKKQSQITSFSEGFPNPFNSSITIRYLLKEDNQVQIDIFNVQGHHVKNLLKENKTAGEYDISWHATNSLEQPVSSGLYLYRIIAGTQTDTQKILLIR